MNEKYKYALNRWKSCDSKVKYISYIEAKFKKPKTQKIYKCPFCKNYHRTTIK